MTRGARALAWSSALALLLAGAAQAQRSGYYRRVSLPRGTVLRAALNDRLSSTDSRPGDRFTGTLRDDSSGLPSGTEVVGRVTDVRQASSNRPGVVDVTFQSLRLPDGRMTPINGQLTSLDSDNVRRTSSGRLEARHGSSSKNKYQFLGVGAGAGAVIAALTGGNLLKGALLGAVAGFAYQQLNKDKAANGRYSEVNLKPGTEFGVLLNTGTTLSLADNPYDQNNDRYADNGANDRYADNGANDRYADNSGYADNGSNDRVSSRYDYRSRTSSDSGYSNGRNGGYSGYYSGSGSSGYSGSHGRYSRSNSGYSGYRERTAGSFQQYPGDARVLVNGQEVRFTDRGPYMSRGHLMVPLAPVLAAAGYRYRFDPRYGEVTVFGDQTEARMAVGDTMATINGRQMRMDAAAEQMKGVLYVPTRFLEEGAGMRADWDAAGRTLRLSTRSTDQY